MTHIFVELSDSTQVVCNTDLETFYSKVRYAMDHRIEFVPVTDVNNHKCVLNWKHIVRVVEFEREDVV